MALTNVDYKLVLTGVYDQETANPIQNVFWYKADAAAGSAQDLATVFISELLVNIASIVDSAMLYTTVEVINLVDLQDFTIASTGVPGARNGNVANRWDSWGFQYLRPIRGMNNGSKRFGPITTSDYTNQVATSGMLVTLDLVSDALEVPLVGATDVTYAPCCVKTVKVANENGNGKFHYEPADLFICNSVAYVGVTHQDSRGS